MACSGGARGDSAADHSMAGLDAFSSTYRGITLTKSGATPKECSGGSDAKRLPSVGEKPTAAASLSRQLAVATPPVGSGPPRAECEGAPPDPGWRQTDDPTTRSRHASPGGAQTPAQLATKREQSDTFSPSSARVALHRHPERARRTGSRGTARRHPPGSWNCGPRPRWRQTDAGTSPSRQPAPANPEPTGPNGDKARAERHLLANAPTRPLPPGAQRQGPARHHR